jgi:DNA-binding response OmpR family regulator
MGSRPSGYKEELRVTKALVIDDEAPIRLLCRVNLEAEGMEVLEAADGEAGLELARAERPDVVLLDVMMPVLDGWQVAERLLEDERTRDIPIIFLTARAELRDRERGLEAGGIAYVTKPFNPLELAVLVEELVSRVARGEAKAVREERIAALRALVEGRPSDFDLKRRVG